MSDNFSEHDNPDINLEDGYPTTRELFDDFCDFGAEGKLELIDSQLIVGNSIVGSRLLLKPLNYWSNITLFVWDIPKGQNYKIYEALSNLSKQPEIRVMDENDYLTVDDENAIARGFVDI